MKVKFVYNVYLFGNRGMTLYPFVLFSKPKHEVSDVLFRHELEHVYQVQRLGWWKFYFNYFLEWVRDGYYKNMFEVLANNAENLPLTAAERKLKDES